MPQYQPEYLLKTKGNVRLTKRRGGVRIAETPTNVAKPEELDEFNLKISSVVKQGGSFKNDEVKMDPPLFRLMKQKGLVRKVPFEAEHWAQWGDKPRDECKRFAQNDDFVSIPDNPSKGYHEIGDQGDGYKIMPDGNVRFPCVYYVTNGGCAISCQREYVLPKNAKQHLLAGTADILGRRALTNRSRKSTEYRYSIRTYKLLSCKPCKTKKRRKFQGSDCQMDGISGAGLDLGAVVLVSFIGPRPDGHVVQHDGETWNCALEFLRWIPYADNYLKENVDPK